jgi:hypothetical protein
LPSLQRALRKKQVRETMTFAWPRRYKFIATFEISAKIRHRYWNVGIFTIAAFGRAVQCVEKSAKPQNWSVAAFQTSVLVLGQYGEGAGVR